MSSSHASEEGRAAAAAFFLLLFAYYLLRPLRETMGIAGGLQALHWVMTAACVASIAIVPCFGFAAARVSRHKLVPGAYLLFAAQLCGFAALMAWRPSSVWIARAFVVWVSVFNLFVVSLFWSVMADLFSDEEARRRFGLISAGGSTGALVGPLATQWIAGRAGLYALPLLSAVLLGAAAFVLVRLMRAPLRTAPSSAARAPRVFEGARLIAARPYLRAIALLVFVATLAPTFVYIFQGHLVAHAFGSPEEQTTFFARLDLGVNVITLVLQLFVAGPLLTRVGVAAGLVWLQLAASVGVAALALAPGLAAFVVLQILHRAGGYGIAAPAQEVLFTVVERDEKYQAKNALETVVARAGDAAAAWMSTLLKSASPAQGLLLAAAVPCLLLTAFIGSKISRLHDALAAKQA